MFLEFIVKAVNAGSTLGGVCATITKNDAGTGSNIGACVGAAISLVTSLIALAGQNAGQRN